MPAFFTSTSRRPSTSTAPTTMRSMSYLFETPQTIVFRPGMSFAGVSRACVLMSQTQTVAPLAEKAVAISRSMHEAPAANNTRRGA